MNVNFKNNFNYYRYNNLTSFNQKRDANVEYAISFGKKANSDNKFMRALRNYILAGTLLLGTTKCVSPNTYSSVQNIDGVKVECFDVKKETMDSALTPLFALKSQLNKDNDFLDGVNIDIAKKYSSLDDANSFRKYLKENNSASRVRGSSFYSDTKLPRRIAIQESSHKNAKLLNLIKNGEYSSIDAIRQTVMHEAGHLFDQYFGHNHNAKFAKKWDEIQEQMEKNNDNPYCNPQDSESLKAQILFEWNNSLSDKSEFQQAMLKDLEYIANLKKHNKDALAANIDYYTATVNFDKEITPHVVDLINYERSEVYANLFSFALGQDDGDKERFVDNFKNSYEVVKKDINNILHINVK